MFLCTGVVCQLRFALMNCVFPWCYRRYDGWLRSSLSGLYRAERCEEPHRGTAIQGTNMGQHHQQTVHLHFNIKSKCFLILPSSSWTFASSRTRLSTSRSVSRAASDQWEYNWWQRVRSRNFESRWWPSQTRHPTRSKCIAWYAGRNTQTSSWEKQFPERGRKKCCGERDNVHVGCGEHWTDIMSPLISMTHEWIDELCLWDWQTLSVLAKKKLI